MSDFKHYIVYKTTNIVNEKIYIGIHATNDLDDGYLGSGTKFKRSLRHYGKDKFKRDVLHDFDNSHDMLVKESELVTKEFVKRKDTYNLVLGGTSWASGMLAAKDKDGKTFSIFKDDPRWLSGELVGATTGTVTVKDKYGNTSKVFKDDTRYVSGELVHITTGMLPIKDKYNNIFQVSRNDLRWLSGELVHITKGMITVRDRYNNMSKVFKDDIRYVSGELVPATVGMITVKDKDGRCFNVSKDDPRWLSGELVHNWKNRNHKLKTKEKIGRANSISQLGKKNSQYGTCWITNGKKNKKVKREKLDIWIEMGWKKGRIIK